MVESPFPPFPHHATINQPRATTKKFSTEFALFKFFWYIVNYNLLQTVSMFTLSLLILLTLRCGKWFCLLNTNTPPHIRAVPLLSSFVTRILLLTDPGIPTVQGQVGESPFPPFPHHATINQSRATTKKIFHRVCIVQILLVHS